ncbi:hypothetical protein [Nitratidesulfovibrio sp. SRB-5]|uniref:hypothetical protein n=1 Tax=Nitratidesulfovibrio sp. SRB-5 TaxID=2872636 RepID=UPI001CBE7012|nr:hypothetical protein [Nitratidesulfovibrio sp. SRB-5]MBZ2173481.1 hypothetical protein [Nitratidesulfovibrio sp. SRB-5]
MTATADTHPTVRSGVFRFDPAHPLFVDHFPGAPVVPGSCIVQAFADEASRWAREHARGDGPDGRLPEETPHEACAAPALHPVRPVREMRGFRFRRFVTPGDYGFRMECTRDGLRCSLHALPHGHAGAAGHGTNGPEASGGPDATAGPALAPLVTGVLAW